MPGIAALLSESVQPADPAPAEGKIKLPPKTSNINPNKPLVLLFSSPVADFDTTKWLLNPDSVPIRDFTVAPDSAGPRALRLQATWAEGKAYTLTLLPGAVTDMYGTANADTLTRILVAPVEKKLGALNLNLKNLIPGQPYVLQLLNGNALEEERIFTATTPEQRFVFSKLQPVTYTATLIGDQNGNGRWDPGNYFAHRQPEPIYARKLEPLRANWEVEASLDIAADKAQKRKTD